MLSKRIKKARFEKSFSQLMLSEVSKVPRRTIEDIETNRILHCRIDTIKKLADALEVSPGWLAWGEDE
jgi:transcriptional regulator with XRE-family HTH domain